ncbi:VOC family protein [Actinoalloteichus spitiensis]|uniref:VOC family protein n=1 Tax=Actinoalloteichus spitiensis TaxID=252394 RepID=UPI00037B67B5|nr:VOC family protein [Actinoalloteichus spitiensis]
MQLTLDRITLGVPHLAEAADFYTSAFPATNTGRNPAGPLDLAGAGRLDLLKVEELAAEVDTDPASSGFRGLVLSALVDQPSEVEALLGAATSRGATVVRPPRKRLFGEFAAAYRAPDGAVWKLAAVSRRNTAPPGDPTNLAETAVYLGVDSPKASATFYAALGMRVDRDYGDKFVDFTVTPGSCRLGLLPREALAGDVGVDGRGDGFSAAVLTHTASSRVELDALLGAARTAGARVVTPVGRGDGGDHVAHVADPDGHHWRFTAPA